MEPTPGSIEAKELGCLCPQMDNNWGAGIGDGRFVINDNCHLHNPNPDDDMMYKCTACGFMTSNLDILDDHLLLRHKVIPYHGKDER